MLFGRPRHEPPVRGGASRPAGAQSEDVGVTTRDHAGGRPDSQMAGLAASGSRPARCKSAGRRPASGAATCWRGCSRPRSPPAGTTCSPSRRTGLTKLVHWLEEQPGRTWQDRWLASGGRRRGQPGVAGAGCGMAPRHRLGQR